jgi:hypothetical protein
MKKKKGLDAKKYARILKLKKNPLLIWKKMRTEWENADDIKLYDKAKPTKEISIPIDEAFKMIDAKRKKK